MSFFRSFSFFLSIVFLASLKHVRLLPASCTSDIPCTFHQVLSYSFVNVTAIEREGKRQKWEKMPPLLAKLLQRMGNMLHVRSWQHTVAAVVVLGESLLDDFPCFNKSSALAHRAF